MVSQDVLTLAENLKKNGLAVSQEEAIRKAEMMLGQSFASKPEPMNKGQPAKETLNDTSKKDYEDFDITKVDKPLKELVQGNSMDEKPITKTESNKVDLNLKRMPPRQTPVNQEDATTEEQREQEKRKRKYAEEEVDLTEIFKA